MNVIWLSYRKCVYKSQAASRRAFQINVLKLTAFWTPKPVLQNGHKDKIYTNKTNFKKLWKEQEERETLNREYLSVCV